MTLLLDRTRSDILATVRQNHAKAMRAALDRAAKAMAEGDFPGMIAAYESLKDYHA